MQIKAKRETLHQLARRTAGPAPEDLGELMRLNIKTLAENLRDATAIEGGLSKITIIFE